MTRTRVSSRLPYKSHPLYLLRRGTLIVSIIGIVLNALALVALSASGNTYRIPIFVFSAFLLLASVAFISHDLITYAAREAVKNIVSATSSDGEPQAEIQRAEKPKWPSKRLVIGDLILAITLQWLFWIAFFTIISTSYGFYSGGSETLEAYANLANFLASIFHAAAFWKEIIARKRAAWEYDLETRPCRNCGQTDEIFVGDSAAPIDDTPPIDVEAGPSGTSLFGRFGRSKITLPKWAKASKVNASRDTQETGFSHESAGATSGEALLVTPEESATEGIGPAGAYGTMSQSVESLNSVPETIVKKKDKGKKRYVDVE